ncbi:MAG: GNAT family N-acetyltransferase [Chloroflexi bacterium]|nr:GNAT family N-acetyltransferase [Chloroflexota bacterium]
MSVPAGYDLRAPIPDDLPAVTEVLIADQLAASGQSVLGADYIRKVWTRPGFELATDAWVVTEGADNIVAYGQVTRDVPDIVESWGVVHPEYRARGIGSVLFERIEKRASELLAGIPSSRFRHAIDARDLAGPVASSTTRSCGMSVVPHTGCAGFPCHASQSGSIEHV